MKRRVLAAAAKFDALSLRERAMVFAAAAGAVFFAVHAAFLTPMWAQQKTLRSEIRQQRGNALGIEAEIAQMEKARTFDPDAAERVRLAELGVELSQMEAALRATQKGLVAPRRITALLGNLLDGHGRLRLLSMKKLPVDGVGDGAFESHGEASSAKRSITKAPDAAQQAPAAAIVANAAEAKPAQPTADKAADLLYRHGVEIVLEGSYGDLVAYMKALEDMPGQLFWARAKLDAADHPALRLTLVLYTLSLDEKWIAL
ncbi:MAG: hypothetical protein H7Z39_00790 [Burkholderiaceae bacterium]|nr:hypothetical protein [Burkholderiaceae bacterium]